MSTLLTACPSRESVGMSSMAILGSGVVNDPANRSLRFDLLKFGLDQFCEEMLKGGAPLKLADDQPVTGRFFAASCQSQILDEETRKSFIVQFQGKGYVWGNPVGRVGFTAAGLVEYATDFQRHEGALYVYFRPRLVDATAFQPLMVESSTAQAALAVVGVNAAELGKRVVDGQLRRGFTVIRWSDRGDTEFGMGVIELGERPLHPYQVTTEDKRIVVNERTELRPGQQDYVGAFAIEDDDQALYLTLSVDGAPSVDALVVPQPVGDTLVDAYIKAPGAQPLAGQALLDEVVQPGGLTKRYVAVPPGRYYLLLDHSDRAGRSAPSGTSAAKVDYLVLTGDVP
ncbi:MAG TPA: hypothetical protein VMS65_06165 [Polyangiaceae bacterium]|nr:hypothetical protein [Polyangiaceae bacterium]